MNAHAKQIELDNGILVREGIPGVDPYDVVIVLPTETEARIVSRVIAVTEYRSEKTGERIVEVHAKPVGK